MTRHEKSHYDRAEALVDVLILAHGRGDSIVSIARTHGLRRDAVTDALTNHGVLASSPARDVVLAYVRDNPGLSVDDLAQRLGLAKSSVSRHLRGAPERRLVVSRKNNDTSTYDNGQMFDALRAAWSMLGDEQTKGLSRVKYAALMAGAPNAPAAPTFIRRWGSWSKACELAGISAAKARRSSYVRQWSNEDILHAVNDFIDETGRTSYHAYASWAQAHGRPSGPLLVLRLGSWSEARTRALRGADDLAAHAAGAVAAAESESSTYQVRSDRRRPQVMDIRAGMPTSSYGWTAP